LKALLNTTNPGFLVVKNIHTKEGPCNTIRNAGKVMY